MDKKAFKYNKIKNFKKFRLLDESEMAQAGMRQKGPNSHRKVKAWFKSLTDPSKDMKGHYKSMTRKEMKQEVADASSLGTVYPSPKGRGVALDKDYINDLDTMKKYDMKTYKDFIKDSPNQRELLAHEAFHANTPVLGQSEILAHAYGGLRKNRNASKSKKIKDAIHSVKTLKKGRPDVFKNELALVGSTGIALGSGAVAVKRLKEERDKKKNA